MTGPEQVEELIAGWVVFSPDGAVVEQSDGPIAVTMVAASDVNGGGDDGSDRAGAGEPDS